MNPEKRARLEEEPKIIDRAANVKALLGSITGEDPSREGLEETPLRVAAMFDEIYWGYGVNTKQLLRDAMFTEPNADSLVLVKDIPFFSTCEHHLEPIIGSAAVAYIPQKGKIVGLSKLARVVEAVARKLQVQERIGTEILAAIEEVLEPMGAAVIIQARHLCMERRGIQKPGTITITSSLSGVFRANPETKKELWAMLDWKKAL